MLLARRSNWIDATIAAALAARKHILLVEGSLPKAFVKTAILPSPSDATRSRGGALTARATVHRLRM
jgi:hypothetical protein